MTETIRCSEVKRVTLRFLLSLSDGDLRGAKECRLMVLPIVVTVVTAAAAAASRMFTVCQALP